jgi:hypothetical protein
VFECGYDSEKNRRLETSRARRHDGDAGA